MYETARSSAWNPRATEVAPETIRSASNSHMIWRKPPPSSPSRAGGVTPDFLKPAPTREAGGVSAAQEQTERRFVRSVVGPCDNEQDVAPHAVSDERLRPIEPPPTPTPPRAAAKTRDVGTCLW